MKVKISKEELPTDGKATVNKALKNVKHILKKESDKAKRIKLKQENIAKTKKVVKKKTRVLSQSERKRGIVYIGHIPHGFYEDQMKEYFKQFGRVTRVRLARSKQSGKSCGYGYIEFQEPDVAKIAAETMNNYLMAGRLVKTTYIPPEKQHEGFFSKYHWTKEHYPTKLNRLREVKNYNAPETKEDHKIFVKNSLRKLRKLTKTLKAQGIDLEFEIST